MLITELNKQLILLCLFSLYACGPYLTSVRGELLLGGAVVDVGDADTDNGRRAHADKNARDDEDGEVVGKRAGGVFAATHRRLVASAETVDSQLVCWPVRRRRELRHEERHAADTDRQKSDRRRARPVNSAPHTLKCRQALRLTARHCYPPYLTMAGY